IFPKAILDSLEPDLSSNLPFFKCQPPLYISWSSQRLGYPIPGFVSTFLNHMYSAPSRFVHVVLHVTLQVLRPLHLSIFITISICALIFNPIYLLLFTYRNIFITLVSNWSIIIKSITQLCITSNHLCWFHMNSSWCVMASSSCIC